jgi:hypothetical protein
MVKQHDVEEREQGRRLGNEKWRDEGREEGQEKPRQKGRAG